MTAETKPAPGLTPAQYGELLDLYVSARDAWGAAQRFTTSQKLDAAHAADQAFTDALSGMVKA